MGFFRQITFTLRFTLVVAVVLATSLGIALTIGVMGLPAYGKAKLAVRNLWKDLAKQAATAATEQIINYFQKAPISLRMIQGLVEEGNLDATDLETILDICYRSIKENSSFINVYYAQLDGTFYGVFKIGDDFLGSHRKIGPDGKTVVRNYHIGPKTDWVLTNEEISDYDPRKRPFWQTASAHPDGGWTEPYKFLLIAKTGYSYTLSQKVKGQLNGYWIADFYIDNLSTYLQSLNVGKEGIVYIVGNDGTVIAESIPEIKGSQRQADEQRAWANFIRSNEQNGFLTVRHRIMYANRFPQKSQIPWNLITSIHEDDFLLPVREGALRSFVYGLIPCLFFLCLAGLLFGRMSRRLIEIAQEMNRAGNLTIMLKKEIPYSRIREIRMMNHSLHKMQVGLHSFAKYAPVDLIKKVIFSGQSPQLGGTKKEISVIFADLANFTEFTEKSAPDEIAKVLGDFFGIATQEIHKEKGIIDKFMGDAVMALWGAPDPMTHHQMAACRTALALKKLAVSKTNMRFKVGINSGFAMVGNFGSDERMDYTAIGDMVNIAARLEKLNKSYETQILMGPDTAACVKETFAIRPIDFVIPHGRTQVVLIYELIDYKDHVDAKTQQAIEVYTSGLELYSKKQFAQAKEQFEKANSLFGGKDRPSILFIERCANP